MKGILLGGGTGSRLFPVTKVVNKHVLPVGNWPMIFYPLRTLVNSGIDEIIVVSGPPFGEQIREVTKHWPGLERLKIEYVHQPKPVGMSEAIKRCRKLVGKDSIFVIAGDNIFENDFKKTVADFKGGAISFLREVSDPQRFGIAVYDAKGKLVGIEEKPEKPANNFAVTGPHIFDNKVFRLIEHLKPSARGELEITDLLSEYIKKGQLSLFKRDDKWADAGTFESLVNTSMLVKEFDLGMKVAIIGAGMIGQKRARVIKESQLDNVEIVVDLDEDRAKALASVLGCKWSTEVSEALTEKIDVVVVATTHNFLASTTQEALLAGKHVLCEKPLGTTTKEVAECVKIAKDKGLVYKAGYNHRFHPAVWRAKQELDKGKIGELMYIKASYGHGGRPGYEKEWRMDKKISGGGELIDQGAHLIDLSRWFAGVDFEQVIGFTKTAFWPIEVEDNGFLLLRSKKLVASLHASWTEWKNRFEFELYGSLGYLKIKGLGGSYGPESLTLGKRVPGKAPREKTWKFLGGDLSWRDEWQNFRNAVKKQDLVVGSGEDGLKVLEIVETVYKNAGKQ